MGKNVMIPLAALRSIIFLLDVLDVSDEAREDVPFIQDEYDDMCRFLSLKAHMLDCPKDMCEEAVAAYFGYKEKFLKQSGDFDIDDEDEEVGDVPF